MVKILGNFFAYKKNTKNEQLFINKVPQYKSKNDVEIILIQGSKDYKYINRINAVLANNLINPMSYKAVGVWPYIGLTGIIPIFNLRWLIRHFIYDRAYFYRWKRIYKAMGIKNFLRADQCFNPLYKIFDLIRAIKILKNNYNEELLLGLIIDNIKVGDLIYSSYIRFGQKTRIRFNDPVLLFFLYKTIQIIRSTNYFLNRNDVKLYVTSYTSYVMHGVISRVILSHKIPVYSLGNDRPIAKLHASNDLTHRFRYWEYSKLIFGVNQVLRNRALAALELRFSGKNDSQISYMKRNPYHNESISFAGGVDAIVYLHDFFDSPYDHRRCLFNDLYHWAICTLKFIQENKLNIAIKPHPNQCDDGHEVIEQLKREFSDLRWVDPLVSNLELIKCSQVGISVFGTILSEYAYFNKNSIAAGEYPGVDFDISYNPKTKEEYFVLLKKINNLPLKKDLTEKSLSLYMAHNYLKFSEDVDLVINENLIDWESDESLLIGMNRDVA